jgi:hypothetical protein
MMIAKVSFLGVFIWEILGLWPHLHEVFCP